MDLNNIIDSEILYRMVRRTDPDGFIGGKPTAALFMDQHGVSVDRDGGRTEEEIINRFKWRFRKKDDYRTAVKISARDCRDAETYPTPVGNKNNQYYKEIWNSKDEKLITLLKAIKLAHMCKEVSVKEEPSDDEFTL